MDPIIYDDIKILASDLGRPAATVVGTDPDHFQQAKTEGHTSRFLQIVAKPEPAAPAKPSPNRNSRASPSRSRA